MSIAMIQDPSKPSRYKVIGELRTGWDISMMLLHTMKRSVLPKHEDRGRHIILLPGFASDDRYLFPLASYLRKRGYTAEGWGLGFNRAGLQYDAKIEDLGPTWDISKEHDDRGEASVPYLCEKATEQIKRRSEELDQKITLIGWSLGGYVAREAARDLPDIVEQVITMGAPIKGGPKYTSAASFFVKRGMDLDWIEEEVAKRDIRLITQPITNIYSKSDGVVGWKAAIDLVSPNVTNVKVNAAHLGMGFNQKIWKIITTALEEQEQ